MTTESRELITRTLDPIHRPAGDPVGHRAGRLSEPGDTEPQIGDITP